MSANTPTTARSWSSFKLGYPVSNSSTREPGFFSFPGENLQVFQEQLELSRPSGSVLAGQEANPESPSRHVVTSWQMHKGFDDPTCHLSTRLPSNQVKSTQILGPGRSQVTSLQSRQHLDVLSGEIHFRILPFDIKEDSGNSGFLELVHEARYRSRFPATRRSQDAHMSRQNSLPHRDTHRDFFLTDDEAKASIATHFSTRAVSCSIKTKLWTVGASTIAWRNNLAFIPLHRESRPKRGRRSRKEFALYLRDNNH